MLAPVRLMLVLPAIAVTVPLQPLDRPFGVETVSPVGSVSVNATPASATVLAAGFVMVNVNEVVAFSAIVDGLNTFAIEGGATTLTLVEAVPPVPPSVEVMLPVVLFCVPAAMPVTLIENVQEPLATMVPPDRLITFVPAVAVIVPAPQVPVMLFGVEITRPAGSVSLKPTPVSAVAVFGLVMVKLSEVDPFSGMLGAPKAFEIVGGATTVIEALEVLPVPAVVSLAETLLFFTPEVVP
jgi:hypothetical protein